MYGGIMKLKHGRLIRFLSAGAVAALLLTSLPVIAMAESFSAAVTAKSMYVAADARGSQVLGKLPKNTIVTVTDYADGVAKIRYQGRTGYARISDMAAVESIAEKAVAGMDTRVYQKPNKNSKSLKLKEGTSVYVLAVKNGVAMVERDGAVGYVDRKHLILEGEVVADSGELSQDQLERLKEQLEAQYKQEQQQQQEEHRAPSIAEAFTSGKYSNEQLTFLFLTQIMGYNTAAAAGVLANINYESGFKPTLGGDSGTSYGICQWHAARKTRLLDYCAEHDANPDSLAAQLAFLKYELETYYPKVHNYLKGVDDTAQGAYDAGYYFCYNFEAPAARTSQSTKRASSAQSTYYGRYASI